MRLLALLAILLCGCPPMPPVSPPTDADAAETPNVDACAAACAKLLALGCPEGRPNDAGVTCEMLCDEDQVKGVSAQLRPACVADAGSVAALAACGVRCR
jgi:hypothetical protein